MYCVYWSICVDYHCAIALALYALMASPFPFLKERLDAEDDEFVVVLEITFRCNDCNNSANKVSLG